MGYMTCEYSQLDIAELQEALHKDLSRVIQLLEALLRAQGIPVPEPEPDPPGLIDRWLNTERYQKYEAWKKTNTTSRR